jgi:CheY-like chemotaxis protein
LPLAFYLSNGFLLAIGREALVVGPLFIQTKEIYIFAIPLMKRYNHILLVDDNEDDRSIIRHLLHVIDPSLRVDEADNGRHALDLLPNLSVIPDVIFLDRIMPVMDGFAFLLELRSNPDYASFKNIPVVMLTNAIDPNDKYENQVNLYLIKPSSIALFRNMLSAILSHDVAKDGQELKKQFALMWSGSEG